MKTYLRLAAAPMAIAVLMLAGCGGISDLTRERVARSETSVRQAEETLGNSEHGAVELQRAKENVEQARRAIEDNEEKRAERYAHQAQLDAELALAKAESARAREAAAELMASIEALRREAGRDAREPESITTDQ